MFIQLRFKKQKHNVHATTWPLLSIPLLTTNNTSRPQSVISVVKRYVVQPVTKWAEASAGNIKRKMCREVGDTLFLQDPDICMETLTHSIVDIWTHSFKSLMFQTGANIKQIPNVSQCLSWQLWKVITVGESCSAHSDSTTQHRVTRWRSRIPKWSMIWWSCSSRMVPRTKCFVFPTGEADKVCTIHYKSHSEPREAETVFSQTSSLCWRNDSPERQNWVSFMWQQKREEKNAQLDMLGWPWKARDWGGAKCIPPQITFWSQTQLDWATSQWSESVRGQVTGHISSSVRSLL